MMKYNWNRFFSDLQLMFLAMILTNSWNAMNKEFSWLGLAVLINGTILVLMLNYLRGLR